MLATPPAVLVVAGAANRSRVLELPFLRFTGRISYALYLWHVPVFRLSGTTYARDRSLSWIALAGALAVVSTLALEEPLRRAWRSRGRWHLGADARGTSSASRSRPGMNSGPPGRDGSAVGLVLSPEPPGQSRLLVGADEPGRSQPNARGIHE
jgi:peptidoglycan/LPS O-acetylase OafA/YrhL